jgi:4-hydroxyacetophenone monooxygenase
MFEAAVRDEAALRDALADADIAPMLMVLAHLSGDMAILDEVAPHIHGAWSFMEAVPEPLKQKVRDRLVEILKEYASTGRTPPRDIPTDTMQRMMSAGVGQTVPADYIPLLMEETQLAPEDTRAVHWRRNGVDASGFHVVIIGAGFSGLCAGIRLKELGIRFTILEKNPDVGGTWLENRYPGCAVDTPNHFYSYSFNQNPDWTRHFSRRDELLSYIRSTTDKFGIRDAIRFGVEVTSAVFNETTSRWTVSLCAADGKTEIIETNALISAVGQLNRPAMPDIPGITTFQGPLFHTAEWDSSVDLTGKRVAMIGTGASAMQTGPSIAPDVARLMVFQRSRHWVAYNPNYHRTVSPGNLWAIRNIPYFAQWMRFQLFWAGSDGFHPSLKIDPDWTQPAISLNEANHKMREMLIEHMRKELDGDDALLAKVVPPYPPYGKRMLRDNHWFRMLKRPNVDLITDAIDRIETDSIVMKDGTVHKADVIIMATGFHASRMLAPMHIAGRAGHTIRDDWGDDDPRAHLGITVPGFPNLFLLYGPNTNLAHGGSIIFHTECQVRYIAQALRDMVENGYDALEVRREAFDAYNRKLDEAARMMVWTHPGVTSWYKNKHNRLTVLSPWTLLDYWKLTRNFAPSEFQLTKGAAAPANAAA